MIILISVPVLRPPAAQKKVGKALDVMSLEDVFSVVRNTDRYLTDFGYNVSAVYKSLLLLLW